jgi:hypothetical protein
MVSGLDRNEDRLTEEFVVAIESRSEDTSLAVEHIDAAADDNQVALVETVSSVDMELRSGV